MYRAFDLFSGGGGSSCGARLAGVKPVGGIDAWSVAANAFQTNFPTSTVYLARIEDLSAKQVATEVGRIDFLLASPECTNHSVAKGGAPRCEISRRTAFEVIRFARAMQPRWVVVENVVSMRHWEQYPVWLRRLKGLGYKSIEAVLDSNDFGVPQNRKRLFVICDKEKDPLPPRKKRGPKPTIRSALASMNGQREAWGVSSLFARGRAKPTITRARRAIRALSKNEPFLLVYYGSDAAGGWQRLDRPLRTITTLDRFAIVESNESGRTMRMLQPAELIAAMGFPSDYKWPEKLTRRDKIKLIGNAVSPPVMQAIIERLLESK